MPITGYVSSCLGIALPSTLDPSTTAWVAHVVANGGTVSAGRQTLVNNLIVGLKADGVWTKLDLLWILAAENQPSALTDMVFGGLATAQNAPVFTVNSGYTGDGVAAFIDTATNLSSYGGQFTTNSGHISAWSPVNLGTDVNVVMGVSSNSQANNQTTILPMFTDGNVYLRCNDGTPSAGTANASGQGHYVSNRSGASARQGYKNGSNVLTGTDAAGTIPNLNIVLLGTNDTVLGVISGNYQCSQASIGANLSSTDVTNFYNRLRTYMTAVGVP